ncbi:hypothetical protein [Paracoccus cavernae]|uniref:hypothetical protein n=1 Tax=Paracoccus cavernae TaxID=1571207 RepID=UPI00362D63B5
MTSVTFEKKENAPPSAGYIGAEFLTWLDPSGTHNLVAMDPEAGPVEAHTFVKADPVELAQWIDARAGRLNIYYTVNEVRESLGSRKPTKADIIAVRALCADIDPASGVDLDTERARILEGLQGSTVPFGVIVDSGGGFQALAVLSNKMPMTPDTQEWAESHGRGLAVALGGDNVQNVDRLLRLPGPDNIPSPAKRAKGRQQRKAQIAMRSDLRASAAEIEAAIRPVQKPSSDNDASITAAIAEIECSGFDHGDEYLDLPSELRERFEADQQADGRLARLWNSGEINHHNPSGSEYRIKLAGLLKAQGGYNAEDYASLARIWRFANMHRYGREKSCASLAAIGARQSRPPL